MNTIYTPDFNLISEDKSLPAFMRMLAHDVIKNGYISVGEFFGSLSDYEVEQLLDEYEYLSSPEEPEDVDESIGENLVLLTMMLCQADGTIDITTDDIFDQHINTTHNLLIIEYLFRNDLINVNRENYSYSEINLPIATKKE